MRHLISRSYKSKVDAFIHNVCYHFVKTKLSIYVRTYGDEINTSNICCVERLFDLSEKELILLTGGLVKNLWLNYTLQASSFQVFFPYGVIFLTAL